MRKACIIIIGLVMLIYCVSVVYADLTATEGFAIDMSSAGAGTDFTVAFDPTEITGGTTWDDGGDASVEWTIDLSGTDPVVTFGSATVSVTGTILSSVGFDGVGAVDLDYGSADITDHTFTTDGTGTAEIVLPAGSIDGTEILDDTIDSADYAAGSIDYEHLAADVISGAEAVGTFESGDTFLVLEAGVGLREADYDDLPGGGATAWDDIGNPDADDTIALTGYEVGWSTTLDEEAHTAIKINHVDAGSDTTTDTTLFGIHTNTNGDPNLTFFEIIDDSAGDPTSVFSIGYNGEVTSAQSVDAATWVRANAGISTKYGTTGPGFLRFYEDADHGEHYVEVKAITTDLGANYTLTLPPDDGDDGEVLKTNGSGVLDWTAAGGATAWDDITNPDDDKAITFEDNEITSFSFADTDEDMFTVTGSGAFGDVSVMKIAQATGDATDGTVLEVVAADAQVDPLVVSSSGQAGALTVMQNTGEVAILSTLDADGVIELGDGGDNFSVASDGIDISTGGVITNAEWQGTAIADAYVPNDITVDLAATATVATTVTITDNEDTAENNPLVFVAGADPDGGDLGLETDGTAYYTPSTGIITATGFAGALTGAVTGNADTATTATNEVVNDATTGTYYLGMYAEDTGASLPIYTDGSLSYTQATGTLAATDFSGSGDGITDLSAAAIGAASASLDDADASVEWEDAADLESTGAITIANLIDGGSSAIDGDKIEITATWDNITPDSAGCAQADSDDDLSAILEGIDDALGAAGGATAWDNIGNPDSDDTIALAGYEVGWSTTLDEEGHSAITIDHQDAGSDTTTDTTLFHIKTNTNGDPNLTFFEITDDSGGTPTSVFSIGYNGEVTSAQSVDAATWIRANAGLTTRYGTTGPGFLRFYEDADHGEHYVDIQPITTDLAATYVLTLPPDDGDDGEVLKTDGSGNLDWTSNSGSGDAWGDAVDADILPTGNDNTYDLGSEAASFADIWWDGTGHGNLTGALTGNADTATTGTHVTVTDNEDQNEENEVAFIEDASGPGNVGLESDSGFTYNPSSGVLTAAGFAGALTGNVTGDCTGSSGTCTGTADAATHVTVTDNEDQNEENEVAFIEDASGPGDNGLESDSGFTYNPSTGTLTAAAFAGDLTGAVTGNADTATTGTHVTITDNEDQNEENEVTFVEDASGPGNNGLESDSGFTYNPSTGTLTAAEFKGGGGSLTGIDAATGDSATAFFDAGTIEHEYGGLQADVSGWTGLFGITGADTSVEVDTLAELLTAMADVTAFITDDDMPAAGTDPDINAAGEIGRDTDDHSLRGYDGSVQYVYGQKTKTFEFHIENPDDLETGTGRADKWVKVFTNNTGFTMTITKIEGWSDSDNYDFDLFETNGTTDFSQANDSIIDTVECETDSTGVYTVSIAAGFEDATIDNGDCILFVHKDGTTKKVSCTVTYHLNGDVD